MENIGKIGKLNVFKGFPSEAITICQLDTPKPLKTLEKLENPHENWKNIGKDWKKWKTLSFSMILDETQQNITVFISF